MGFARAGIPPGVSMLRNDSGQWKWMCGTNDDATWAARKCWTALANVAAAIRIPVFIDTGAFSELGAASRIPPRMWKSMLEQQIELAHAIGSLAVIVLPDKVGDQPETMRRLETYADQVNELLDAGARGVAVLQMGSRSPAKTAQRIADILGRYDWILGFPVRARGVEPEHIRRCLEEISWVPKGAHLLGIGPANQRWGEYVGALSPLEASAWASSDAVVIKRLVQREKVLGPLTREQDVARVAIEEEAWSSLWDPLVGELIDPTEQLDWPTGWLPQSAAAAIARMGRSEGRLTEDEARAFSLDPTSGLRLVRQRDAPGVEWWLEYELEKAWRARVEAMSTQTRAMRAIVQLFGEHAPTPLKLPQFGQMRLGQRGGNGVG